MFTLSCDNATIFNVKTIFLLNFEERKINHKFKLLSAVADIESLLLDCSATGETLKSLGSVYVSLGLVVPANTYEGFDFPFASLSCLALGPWIDRIISFSPKILVIDFNECLIDLNKYFHQSNNFYLAKKNFILTVNFKI